MTSPKYADPKSMHIPCHNLQFSMIQFADLLSQTLTNGLVKDALRCIRMGQFADLPAQFAVFVVT